MRFERTERFNFHHVCLDSVNFPFFNGLPEIRHGTGEDRLPDGIQTAIRIRVGNPDAGPDGLIKPLVIVFNDVLGRLRKLANIDNGCMVEYLEHDRITTVIAGFARDR